MKIPFDTLTYYRALREAGIEQDPASTMTKALQEALMDFYGRLEEERLNRERTGEAKWTP